MRVSGSAQEERKVAENRSEQKNAQSVSANHRYETSKLLFSPSPGTALKLTGAKALSIETSRENTASKPKSPSCNSNFNTFNPALAI